ncbi:acyl-CoA dehydrogenase family protein [Microscilla marina]|uniref:Acyl-CoA dehydrogenase, long-chain specific n=1 Tax=Microscilla marina ATCC 23134 TaxID=313606 RepID=A1ZFB4_MICM2|nr:acyl-CoA dehydrogenase family protein [Microscilla marina]EAY30688.1 acyl-CoA dehydrogenase, long-chain specific [Microscilla marina ATCC 23134]
MKSNHFTEEHEMFRESLRAFLDKEARPYIDQWEEERRTPRDIWKKMGEQGYLGLGYPEEYGGSGLDFFYDVVFNEEIGRLNSGGFAITQQVTQYMSSPYILKYGSEELKQKYLPGIISGDLVSCIAISEPGAGSDAANIQTRAVREGDHYIVNGSKTFITNGVYGDFIITVVKTDPEAGSAGVSMLVIDRNAEGVTATKLKKLGWHCSDTAELSFADVKVPASNLIGQEGQGFYYLMNGLQLERLCAVPAAVSAMENAIEVSLQYMSERQAFGRPINKFQVLRHRIAQMSAEVTALKAFSYYCCQLYADGVYDVKQCSMAKLLVTEKAEEVATKCLQFFGGYGFMEDYPLARMYRDVRVGTIGGGSSEIMREIIAKIVIDSVGYKSAQTDYAPPKAKKASNGSAPAAPAKEESVGSAAEMLSVIQSQVEKVSALGNTVKFNFGAEQLFIDGTGAANTVSTDDSDADCTVSVSFDDFQALMQGKLNPMNAVMSGQMQIDGDMGVAMKLQSLFG